MDGLQVTEVRTPRGKPATFATRPDTSDLATVGATFDLWGNLVDEYRLRSQRVAGVFVDVGAHIGTASIAVLLDNPQAYAIAVEPLPENVDMIHHNARLNGVADRLTVLAGAVGNGKPARIAYGEGNHRYIGNATKRGGVKVPTYTLAALLTEAAAVGAASIALLKTDCEGGEWPLLTASADDLAQVRSIVGEYHTSGPERLVELLDATHALVTEPAGDGTGLFWAVAR